MCGATNMTLRAGVLYYSISLSQGLRYSILSTQVTKKGHMGGRTCRSQAKEEERPRVSEKATGQH